MSHMAWDIDNLYPSSYPSIAIRGITIGSLHEHTHSLYRVMSRQDRNWWCLSELSLTWYTVSSDPQLNKDRVNIKLKPPPEALAVRRSQNCHFIPRNLEEEFMFMIQGRTVKLSNWLAPEFLFPLSQMPHELVDVVLAMVANRRELKDLVSCVFLINT